MRYIVLAVIIVAVAACLIGQMAGTRTGTFVPTVRLDITQVADLR